MHDSLQLRIGLLTGLAVALTAMIIGGVAYGAARHAVVTQLDTVLSGIAAQAAPSITGSEQDLKVFGGGSQVLSGGTVVAVITPTGVLHPPAAISIMPGAPERAVAADGAGRSLRSVEASNGEPYRMIAVPAAEPGVALLVARPLANQHMILQRLTGATATAGVVGVLLAVLVGAAVARSSLRPVRELTEAVEAVARTEEPRLVRVSGRHELSRLATSFNAMVASLALAREQQARLIADAGHELRTPLTSLRTNIELLELDQRAGLLDDAARQAMMRDVKAQLLEFSTLIGDLVQLARIDRRDVAPVVVDLRQTVQAAVDRARRRGATLIFDVELDPFVVRGHAADLERAFTNLLDNAVKFSPPQGMITVRLRAAETVAVLRVIDQGPGIPDDDLPLVFDRFFRSDTSRHQPGTGLGLSIVAHTVAQHDGTVHAARAAGGGAELVVRLPGAPTVALLPEPPAPAQPRPGNLAVLRETAPESAI